MLFIYIYNLVLFKYVFPTKEIMSIKNKKLCIIYII